jgi:hypothetical protein
MLLLSRTKEMEPVQGGDLDHGCGHLTESNCTGSHVYLLGSGQSHLPASHAHVVTKACVPHDAKTIRALWFYATLEPHNHQV